MWSLNSQLIRFPHTSTRPIKMVLEQHVVWLTLGQQQHRKNTVVLPFGQQQQHK